MWTCYIVIFLCTNIRWLSCISCVINSKCKYWLFDLKRTAGYQCTRLLVQTSSGGRAFVWGERNGVKSVA